MKVKTGIVGVTGYTGAELARILLSHPQVELCAATSRRFAGRTLGEVLPQFSSVTELELAQLDPARLARELDVVFLCLPHGGSMETAAALLEGGARVVDLSADFRMRTLEGYRRWYGEHTRPELLDRAVPGIPELYRKEIAGAALLANPGCYPTSVLLAALPLLQEGMVDEQPLVADSKSGVSGAGREPAAHLHFPQMEGNFTAYKAGGTHRHTGEMEQALSAAAGRPVILTFTPHLLPVSRGILTTLYLGMKGSCDQGALDDLYRERYRDEPFVQVRSSGEPLPGLKEVRGTNCCIVAPRYDERTGRAVVVSCLDNLVKGAAGQAVQNMNLMTGLPEDSGLRMLAQLP